MLHNLQILLKQKRMSYDGHQRNGYLLSAGKAYQRVVFQTCSAIRVPLLATVGPQVGQAVGIEGGDVTGRAATGLQLIVHQAGGVHAVGAVLLV